MTPLIRIRNLTIGFPKDGRDHNVVHGLDLTINAGETLALVGESGSGKSVTARALLGLSGPGAKISADQFDIEGQSVLGFGEKQWRALRGTKVGFVLQDALVSLDPLRRVSQQLSDAFGRRGFFKHPDLLQDSRALLQSVGIPDPDRRLPQYPHELSGGLRQRALIATAIARHPALLIADEPTTALDATVQKQILDLLAERRKAGHTLLLISHDLAVVSRLADRVLVMNNGYIVEEGPTAKILKTPEHPYTRQLLDAVPSASSKGFRLSPSTEIELKRPAEPIRIALPPKQIDEGRIVLSASNLVKRYGTSLAVNDVSFNLAAGEALGIVGESGSGKTTVAKIILGLVEPDGGSVLIEGKPWSNISEAQRRPRRAHMQLIAQDALSSFDPRYTVEKIVGESLDSVGVYGDARRNRVIEVLDAVRLNLSFLSRYPRELSGGQRQRVAIARAFAPHPTLLVADEPVSALDVSVQAQVLDLLAELQAASGTSLLFISHDLGVVHHLTDRVVVMKDGRIVEAGQVENVFSTPRHSYTRALLDAVPTLA
ncbi:MULTISPECIES: dipeptide ABC transporter ATP-binding protein [Rhizobium/Agrobacterium group]|uniref:dipeptide ABC transporter ATP-binding protein n=1 Tax=Rhizobium/Agrobacterium group TaxID=227290 RepID=UPI0012E89FC5|nr:MULTISPECIES: ABC transporter ATP-binding protein [Rhizobium/Agrobacterium group]MCF1473376.1 ABC transporter ATP-binding protein [Allorhizobium ampelinum]MVA51043.1 dipeptide ABC transporter ATP-binding protein [Agrobacterium vitis]NSZ55598.1 ABC transporter ATP-binding protein [Agrobacterium vitis]NTA34849.1 ABC transporter ATP-binding protein [Agrobacterium vitis]